MAIPPDFLEALRDRVAVSEVVRRHVELRKQGREWAGLSPFNKEKTPSFFVNDDKRFYHCFSSGKHGDVFSFLTDATGLTFREAVEYVAGMAGMEVPADGPEAVERRRVARGIQYTLDSAAAFYESQLRMPGGRAALTYLRERGLDDATIRRFRLGYAPPSFGSLAAALNRDEISQDLMVEAGLLKRRDDGQVVDYFRDRVMFPIADRQGRVIAFGGRTLTADVQPKYLNSPETAVFHKGRTLYGLAQAREAAHKSGRVLVVEGYMDVIALAQAGLAEAVAPLGTALGEDQIRLLWTLSAEPLLCLDGDRAGRAAAIRAAERALPLLTPGRSLRFAMLPSGEDPDSLVRKAGATAINELLKTSVPLQEVVWQAEWERCQPTTPERRAAFHRAIFSQVKRIGDQTVHRYYEQAIRERLQQVFAAPRRSREPQHRRYRSDERTRLEQMPTPRKRPDARKLAVWRQQHLLGMLALHPALIPEFAERVMAITIKDGGLDTLRNRIITLGVADSTLDAPSLAAQVLAQSVDHPLELGEVDKRQWHAVCASARAALSRNQAEGQEPLMDVRCAVQELIEALEQDGIRADLASQVKILGEAPENLDRIQASIAAERDRASTQF
jgi:DNA primase